jgi:hypothetical protein
MKRFNLYRKEDESGISGTGVVAQGVQFDDDTCTLRWLTGTASTAVYDSIDDIETIHGHGGKTIVDWIDEDLTDDDLSLMDRIVLMKPVIDAARAFDRPRPTGLKIDWGSPAIIHLKAALQKLDESGLA